LIPAEVEVPPKACYHQNSKLQQQSLFDSYKVEVLPKANRTPLHLHSKTQTD